MEWQILLQNPKMLRGANWTLSYTELDGGIQPTLPEIRTVVLGTIIPAAVVAFTLTYDFLSTVHLPKFISGFIRFLRAPFMNFIYLEDLEEEPGEQQLPPLWKSRLLAILSCLEAIGWAAVFAYNEFLGAEIVENIQAGVGFLTWSYAFFRVLAKPPVTPPYLLIIFYMTHALVVVMDIYGLFQMEGKHVGLSVIAALRLAVPMFLTWIAGTYPLEPILPAKNVASGSDIPSNTLAMPEDRATLWSWCTFSFVEPIFGIANQRTINEPDVWSLSPYFTHKNLFNKYLEYCQQHPTHSLLRFLIVSNSLDLILDVALEMWSAFVGFVPPYCLQRILSALADPAPEARSTAYVYTFVMFLANLSFAQVDINQRWYTRRCYERTRGQLFCALHYKALKRRDVGSKAGSGDDKKGDKDESENESADLGKIVNLMQGDAYSVAQRFWDFSGIFASPVRLTIAMVFLYKILGWSSFAGVAVILLAYILNYPLAKYSVYITRQSWSARDRRMKLINELFQNIRFLKFYGWETRWTQRVRDSRENELKWRVRENIVSTLISFIWIWIPSATALSCFLCYTLIAKEKLTVSKAFTSVALFSQLQGPMTRLPDEVFAYLRAYVSMKRIQQFLQEPEVPDWACSLKATTPSPDDEGKVGFEDAAFEWDVAPKSADLPSRFTLGPLNIQFPKGKMTLVSGATGSGKSAMLAALLGEMHAISGRVILNKLGHQVAYCAQNPWLEHATIRDNIIFASKFGYDEARYNAVIEACALTRDLEIFEAGDMTEIGEKGITLSGGQRARIALARALYSQASCILLDDPLAAVDMHTAQHLVKNVLSGDLARDRTIILVTHHISLCLPVATYLVELSGGRVIRQGSIEQLRSQGLLQKVVEDEDIVEDSIPSDEPTKEEPENQADLIGDVGQNDVQKKAANGKLIDAEARAEGRVALSTYMTYIKAAGVFSWILIVFLMVFLRVVNIGSQFYLAKWGEAYERTEELIATAIPWEKLPNPNANVIPWLFIYLFISLAGALSVVSFIAVGYYSSLQASRTLFNSMLSKLAGAPTRFYDITPIGRILNRFTTDLNCIDYALLNSVRAAMSGVLNFIASIGVIIWVVPSFAPFAAITAWLYIRLAPSYVQASRDLRRLESISLSPAFAGFDELLRGLPHVRAFAMEARYQNGFYKKVDKFQSYDHVYWLVANWLMWRYDCLGSVIVFISTAFALMNGVNDGLAALVIVQAGVFAEASRQLVRVLAQLELDANSVERVVEYLEVAQEAPAVTFVKPPAYWPSSNGELVVDNLVVKYAPDLPAVLHQLSFTVRAAEKVGVVGRTGSGKSTLALSLLRIVEASGGRILIDGIDISTLGLDDLRTRVTIISQDVSLFSGTIRSNLDPFNEHTDEECWEVLERCHLTTILKAATDQNKPDGKLALDMPISQTGSLSAGERQLVAMARALLRRSNVVILDEATSQIDTDLDDQIQRTIREEFKGSIVITIAHRLRTVLDYDRILVLGGGEILEFDSPKTLLNKSGGVFREMCKASADWPMLQLIAEASES
ncbi:P-loop containing nucleoside triphosphate hydrolase protein [Cristinia sonorae]|uniref:P-loop containing nucleoside triphosphate hydrolase protein n=1 Tax=Cristinia sonorae TaxID=1940300 RepID=A0A8K0UP46_9AGAR|nr:P-loop containing nucleoside triphosphate hydrolase protein [Cristinia sonorae]